MAKILDKTNNYIIVKFTPKEYSKIQEKSIRNNIEIVEFNFIKEKIDQDDFLSYLKTKNG